jgi:predicted  nucleic acid-binding Zn-ribbon protein
VAALDDLLVVQELDTSLDQLRHRRAHLPELATLEALGAELTSVRGSREQVAARLHAVRAAQKEAEDHASLLEDKAAAAHASMYDGSVVAHKELEALQEEHASLQHRQGEFEDRALELMEEAEPIESELAAHDATLADLESRLAAVEADLLVARTEIDVEVDRVQGERDAAAQGVPAELLEAYGPLRESLGGVAVARLHGARCEGCHLEIPSAELEDIRRAPADALVSCPECLRILVR